MTEIRHVNPGSLHDSRPLGYSQAAVAVAAEKLVFISGQLGGLPDGTIVDGFEAQVRQSFANLGHALAAAGLSAADVVKITLLVVDHDAERLRVIAEARRGFFGANLPASTLIPVPRLAGEAMLFEVDAVAVG
ncbi:MAG: RidA family protein [Alphaproteobacteria bacterium]|nr:RidA family protein [Alphaproteobacteria bacterium]